MTTDVQTLEVQIREAEELCDRLLEDIASIKDQIDRAASTARQTGNYSDSDWYHAAKRALRYKQAEHQKTLRQAAELRRELKSMRRTDDISERTFERQFMIEAKALLSETTYREVIARTQRATGEHT